jgi:hypothetical protein
MPRRRIGGNDILRARTLTTHTVVPCFFRAIAALEEFTA